MNRRRARGLKARHEPVAIEYQLVEIWRCAECGRRFKRATVLSFPAHAPRGYETHMRACYRKARRLDLEPDAGG